MADPSSNPLHVPGNVTNQVLGDVQGDVVGRDKVMGNSLSGIFFNFALFDPDTDFDDLPFPRFLRPDMSGDLDDEDPVFCLPLTVVDMFVEVYGPVSRVKLRQTFVNPSAQAIPESSYALPLYGGSTLISFKFTINGDEVLHSTIRPRAEAATLFEKAVADGRVAALLEAKAPEVFQNRVGFIPAQSYVEVETVYINQLKWNTRGDTSLTVPTWVAPRYRKSFYDHSTQHGEGVLRIRAKFFAELSIRKVFCATHLVSVETRATATVSGIANDGSSASGDVEVSFLDHKPVLKRNLTIQVTAGAPALQSHAIWEDLPGTGPALIVQFSPNDLFPQNSFMDYRKAEFVFVVNRSRSMTTGKIGAAREVLKTFLRHLPKQTQFNIHSFASDFSSLWPNSCSNSSESFNAAMQHIETFEVGLGENKILQALKKVVDQRIQGLYTTQVIILTDEQLCEEKDEVLHFINKCVAAERGKLRFFCLGIGCTIVDRFINDLGRLGGGFGSILPMKNRELWSERAFEMIQGAMSPWKFQISLPEDFRTPTTLKNSAISEDRHQILEAIRNDIIQAPYILDSVNPFEWTTAYLMCPIGLTTAPPNLTIQAMTLSCELVQASIPIKQTSYASPIVHQLAARAIMNDIDNGKSWLHAAQAEVASDGHGNDIVAQYESAIAEEAKRLGLEWSIPGKWTSLVAVDDKGSHSDPRIYHVRFDTATLFVKEQQESFRTRSGPVAMALVRGLPAKASSHGDSESCLFGSSVPDEPAGSACDSDAASPILEAPTLPRTESTTQSNNFMPTSLPGLQIQRDNECEDQQEHMKLLLGYIYTKAAFHGYVEGIKVTNKLVSNPNVSNQGNSQTLSLRMFYILLVLFSLLFIFILWRLTT